MSKKLLGGHLSISKGIHSIQDQMEVMNADTCALFLKNQRTFNFKPIEAAAVEKFKEHVKSPQLLVPHGSYLINLANPLTVEKSYACFIDDMRRCHALGILYYNIHPGSDTQNMGKGALKLIADNINRAMKEVPNVVVLLENMAGQGNVCGKTFEELRQIIDQVEDQSRMGVTLDTCHLFGAGYDIRTEESFEKVMRNFDDIVGLDNMKALHLNDSKCELNSKKDRHEQIGKGKIGLDAFKYIMNSPYFDNIPMVLETPDDAQYKKEIQLLRSLVSEE